MSDRADGKPDGPSRSYRHRGPRRATGGDTNGQGEPQRLAGFAEPEPGGGQPAGTSSGETREVRDRWLREQRPPHWG